MSWPKRTTVYLHSSKETMWEKAEELGLEGKALQLFRHALCEVEFELLVNEDGSYRITKVNDA